VVYIGAEIEIVVPFAFVLLYHVSLFALSCLP